MKYLRRGLFGLLLCIVAVSNVTFASGAEIEQVEINVWQEDSAAKGQMENRVTASIQAVSEKLLVGRKVADVEANRQRFEDIIRQVFDRVLYGYELTEVHVTPEKRTIISLKILPWGEVVQSTTVQIDTGGFASEDQKLINQDLAGLKQKIDQILIGLPVDAFAWADSVSKAMIREVIAAQLPEFRAEIECIPAKDTVINIKLQPMGPLIRKTEVRLQSESIPKLLLLPVNGAAEDVVEKLNGLPVAFVQRHREEYVQRMQQAISRSKYIHKYDFDTQLALDLGEKTRGEISVETDKYRINLEGVLDLGREGNNNTMFRGHAGYMVNNRDEVFMAVEFFPNTISWHFQPGYGRQFSTKTYIGLKRDLRDNEDIGLLHYKLNDDLLLEWEQNLTTGDRLAGIRYQIHDYLAAEAISDRDKTWLRLIADL